MNIPTFKTISVEQYQQLYSIGRSDSEDKDIQLVACITGMTLTQVEDMRLDDFNAACRAISAIFSVEPDVKPRRRIRISGRTYRIIYNPRQLSPGKYIEIQEWLKGGAMENMDKIMASLLVPVWWNKHKPSHPELCEGVKVAKFITVHSACVFFCRLWTNSIVALSDYLDSQPEVKKMTAEQRRSMKKLLQVASAGFSMQSK